MDADAVFKAMADGTRQRVLSVLGRQELSVGELVEVLDQPQSTVSRHLKVLRDAGLVADRRQGPAVHYAVRRQGDGSHTAELAGRLVDWVDDLPLETGVAARLEHVIDTRRAMSRTFFDRVGTEWDELREGAFGSQFHLEAFIGLLPRGWRVVDVGTGTGYLLPTLARHFAHVIGVEPVERMLDGARQRVGAAGLRNVELHRGDMTKLPIDAGSVDLAIATLVLHHVATPREAVMELGRVVTAGGRVMLIEQLAHENEAFRERMQDRWWGFEVETLAAMVESAGFEQVSARMLLNVPRAADAPELFVMTATRRDDPRDND